ncbi:MAG: hypothetical protein U5K69_03755 [Balneolaceae bacterium]|nr:hypothetical protein [Balneolaceae bacterium]
MNDGSVHHADAVVSNADVAFTYRHMIPESKRNKYTNRKDRAHQVQHVAFCDLLRHQKALPRTPSWNITTSYLEIVTKRLSGGHLQQETCWLTTFRCTCTCPPKPTLPWHPKGTRLFMCYPRYPTLTAVPTGPKQLRPYRDAIMNFLEDNYLPGLQENLVVEHHIDPLAFPGYS